LDSVDLSVDTGEFVCVLGSSGCGKSTLLRVLAGFERRKSGTLQINGITVDRPDMERIMIFQDFDQLLPWKTVLDNMLFPLRKRYPSASSGELTERARRYLNMTGLNSSDTLYPDQLSGGMKQRAAFARALALDPKLLLMDEPFASLDMKTRASLQQLVLQLWMQTDSTIIFVTHDVNEAVLLADTVYVMGSERSGSLRRYKNPLRRPRSQEMDGFRSFYMKIARAITA